ncbi:MAG TPA: beta-propeller fold lactonase family protein [Terriglobales bacterium]|nr:beta-propeller fold lactonase family protein [Terriglobales bacterium]
MRNGTVAASLSGESAPRSCSRMDRGRTTRLKRLAAVTLASLAAAGFFVGGCSSEPKPSTSPDGFLYATNFASDSITGYSVNSVTGALSQLPQFPLPTGPGSEPSSVVAAPSGNFLYTWTNDGCRAYRVNRQSGVLTEISGSPFQTLGAPVVTDPAGKFLLTMRADRPNDVSVYAIDPGTGAITAAGPPVTVGRFPHIPAFTPDSSFLYVSSPGRIQIFSFDGTTGQMAETAASPFFPAESPGALAVIGDFLLVAAFPDAIAAYSINSSTGELTLASGSPVSISRLPVGPMTVHPSGKFLYVVDLPHCCSDDDFRDSGFSVLSVNPATGALEVVPGSPFKVGTEPSFLSGVGVAGSIDPAGNFLYATNHGNGVLGYRIEATTGSLTPLAGSPFPAGLLTLRTAILSQQEVSQ